MIVVFAAFMLEDNRDIKEFGLGLAAAVLMDAIVIRAMIVPALMLLLGRSKQVEASSTSGPPPDW